MSIVRQQDLQIANLGECQFASPLRFGSRGDLGNECFRSDQTRLRTHLRISDDALADEPLTYEEAGPRQKIFFEPSQTTAAIVTCGGLSPGLNNVIRSLYYELTENYGVARVLGIPHGYRGLTPQSTAAPVELSKAYVEPIDKLGGTILGTSRGPQPLDVMADFLEAHQIDILFCLGGDGTQRGASSLDQELRRRNQPIAIVGIPKTIDNDVPFVELSFGYTTALEKAEEVIRGAHTEARGVANGIGLVKLMGRHAGFIAAGATVVSQEVNFTLVPEVPFPLRGDDGLLPALERRLRARQHAVIVVAEGAGQDHFADAAQATDASGNRKNPDIGPFLREQIKSYFFERDFPVSLKYLDPSYFIRSVPADVYDRFLCDQLARHAAHAAMAGKTGMMIGLEHSHYIHVPIPTVVRQPKTMGVTSELWRAVLQSTGQPRW